MIAEIRSYFKGVVRSENSDLKVISHPITDEMADTVVEDSYFVGIGDMSTALLDTTIQSDINIILNIYRAGDVDATDDYDDAYCDAIDIQANAMFKENIDQATAIKNVTSSGIEISTINNNDNMFKFSIQFTVTVGYVHEK